MNKFSKQESFIKNLKKSDSIVICFDQDGDGIPSAVLLEKALNRLHFNSINFVPFRRHSRINVAEDILSYDPTHVIILDISAEGYPEFMAKLTRQKVLIIDHHEIMDPHSEAVIIKPQLFGDHEPAQYPTGKLVYEYMSSFVDLSDLSWLVSVAIIADSSTVRWHNFLQEVFDRFDFKMKEDWNETTPGKIGQIINSATSVAPKRTTEIINLLSNSSIPEIMKSSLADLNLEINSEIASTLSDPNIESHHSGKLNILEIKPKYSIGGVVSNKLSFANTDKTYIIITKYSKHAEVSARNQSNSVACNELLKAAIKGFEDSNAGGHEPAAGAAFPIKYLSEFKQNLVTIFPKLVTV